jgi:ATP-binding cassette, subfamily F, member 3
MGTSFFRRIGEKPVQNISTPTHFKGNSGRRMFMPSFSFHRRQEVIGMIVCGAYDISVHYGATRVLAEATVEINEKERIGIVGRNGSGKTTLLKALAGIVTVSGGRIYWQKNLKAGLLAQIPEIEPQTFLQSVLEEPFRHFAHMRAEMTRLEKLLAENGPDTDNILKRYGHLQETFADSGGYEMDARIRRIASGLRLTPLLDQAWGSLSGGERTRVGLALILLEEPGLLLLDEPTNHLDMAAMEWLAEYVRGFAGSVVMVSHDRYFLDQTAEKIVEVEEGALTVYHTDYSGYRKEREERMLQEFLKYQDQQKKIKKMKEAIKRLRDWANRSKPPSEALHRRASSMEKALARVELVEKPVLQAKQMDLTLNSEQRSSERVFVLANVQKRFGELCLLDDANLTVLRGERIAIVGDNGSGKTTLLKIILGKMSADAGTVQKGPSLSVGYLSQHGDELDLSRTVLDEFRSAVPVSESQARHILARFLFYADMVFQVCGSLSGGEKMRLRWAQMMHQKHNVLVLDEPTNHMDTDSREVLEDALAEFPGTVVAVSHDRYLLDRHFPVTYWLDQNTLHRYEGNYSYAAAKRADLYAANRDDR